MLSKVATTLGLSSASMAASESEFSISSSSKSASPAGDSAPSPSSPSSRSAAGLNGVAAAGAARGGGRLHQRTGPWRGGAGGPRRTRLATIASDGRRRHGLGVRAGISGFEIDDVAQEDLALVELVAPDDDGLEGERALAQAGDHR